MYELHDNFVLRLADGAYIPKSEGNRDYLEYLDWEKGNKPSKPPEPPKVIPSVVSRFQAKAALDSWQLLDDAEALIAAPDCPAIIRLVWKEGGEFRRASPTVQALAGQLGLTAPQLDDLFVLAEGIEV